MDHQQFDLNLLVALDALLTDKSVTRAGARMNLSQSAMSGTLARLRDVFHDELLVPVGRGMASGKALIRRSQPALFFKVSQDEEHAWLEMHDAGLHLNLGERSHHYALLILARLRLADAQRQLAPHAQGWVELDRLAKMLGIDPGHLNIQIFRMRKQLALAMPPGAHVPELIERRRGSLRFGSLRFRITRGAALEADFDPLADDQSFTAESLVA